MALGEVATRDFLRSELGRLEERGDIKDGKKSKEPKERKANKDLMPEG